MNHGLLSFLTFEGSSVEIGFTTKKTKKLEIKTWRPLLVPESSAHHGSSWWRVQLHGTGDHDSSGAGQGWIRKHAHRRQREADLQTRLQSKSTKMPCKWFETNQQYYKTESMSISLEEALIKTTRNLLPATRIEGSTSLKFNLDRPLPKAVFNCTTKSFSSKVASFARRWLPLFAAPFPSCYFGIAHDRLDFFLRLWLYDGHALAGSKDDWEKIPKETRSGFPCIPCRTWTRSATIENVMIKVQLANDAYSCACARVCVCVCVCVCDIEMAWRRERWTGLIWSYPLIQN